MFDLNSLRCMLSFDLHLVISQYLEAYNREVNTLRQASFRRPLKNLAQDIVDDSAVNVG